MIIRWAEPGDEADWRRLWQGFLDYYQWPLAAGVTDFTWARLMEPGCAMKMRLAEQDGRVMGFAIHQHHPSTWVMGDDAYLEDLYVDPSARGQGLGRALVEDLYAIARQRGWQRVYWLADQDNQVARRLYDSLAPSDNHIRYRRTI